MDSMYKKYDVSMMIQPTPVFWAWTLAERYAARIEELPGFILTTG
jgi:hypothetical protein